MRKVFNFVKNLIDNQIKSFSNTRFAMPFIFFIGYVEAIIFPLPQEIQSDPDIIKKVQTPYDERNEFFLEAMIRQGRLYYNKKEIDRIDYLSSKKPLILVVNLERPAILTQIQKNADAVLVDFGSSNDALLDIIFGEFNPSGKLPFELPSSWEAVLNQKEDLPYDSKDPLYNYGHGLSYDLL